MAVPITIILGVILLILGIVLAIIGIVLIIARKSGSPIEWYMWLLIVGGIILSLIGLILLGIGIIFTQEEKKKEDLDYRYVEMSDYYPQQRPTQPSVQVSVSPNTNIPPPQRGPIGSTQFDRLSPQNGARRSSYYM